jgi:hypothetical protein
MKTNEPENRDDALSKVLKEWRTEASLPPRFQEAVWQRIGHAQTHAHPIPSLGALIAHWIGTVLPRPALAAAYLAIVLGIAATLGWAEGRQENSQVKSELSERYVRVLDPFQVPRQ